MKNLEMKSFITIVIILFSLSIHSQTDNYKPKMIAPNVISKEHFEGHASITPDGNEMYYAVYTNDHSYSTIVYSKKTDNKWTEPRIATFSGKYNDGSPSLSPDGLRLYFSSKRHVVKIKQKKDNDIWYVERSTLNSPWEEPKWIKEINTEYNEFSPSVDKNENLYFCSNRPEGFGDMDVYYTKIRDKNFDKPTLLNSSINSKYQEGNVGVSPDGELLFVMVQHKPGDFGYDDIHYSKKNKSKWLPLKNIGLIINTPTYDFSPKVSPDGKTLYFSSRLNIDYTKTDMPYNFEEFEKNLKSPYNGLGNIYKISIDSLNLN